jgi:hypothetical protein
VAKFELTAAVQEDAERDEAGVRRDLGGDLIPGPGTVLPTDGLWVEGG